LLTRGAKFAIDVASTCLRSILSSLIPIDAIMEVLMRILTLAILTIAAISTTRAAPSSWAPSLLHPPPQHRIPQAKLLGNRSYRAPARRYEINCL
jgi:hypothetical protein